MITNISLSTTCKQVQVPSLVNFQGGLNMDPLFRRIKDKVVVIMGATGTGKSRLAIDLATRFPAEIVNSDKMQVYKGLDIVTNKVTEEECCGVPHHLLGIADPYSNFSANDFCHHASLAIDGILQRDRLPIIAGGSNSYIEALVNDDAEFRLRYQCCCLWVDVSLPVLHSFVSDRVDRMVEAGLIDEVKQTFDPMADYSKGVRRAIGVPELDQFLRAQGIADERTKSKLLEAAIARIKVNNCILACRQLEKIHRLHTMWEWNMHHLDATQAFNKNSEETEEIWKKHVLGRSTMIVGEFLRDQNNVPKIVSPPDNVLVGPVPMATVGMAAASH
ncbi:Adenylate isopentenyltransferase [Quillaja saponaria]|uniref:adenylate dimethylallyltransferase (ADP/ATP-dependent) n=1 Tax=Quillaja saponaria TaxID=32244 RepID=A0AAD7LCN7_QUISA|nr:Adenylate isopentenyltransferase [Quillaja saponaria]